MNRLKGIISDISVHSNLTLVEINLKGTFFKSIVIETPATAPYLAIDSNVEVLFKETEVIIGVGQEPEISLRNRLKCSIESVEKGALLSKLTLQSESGEVRSVITSNAVEQLKLREGSEVWAMVKTNEVMLSGG